MVYVTRRAKHLRHGGELCFPGGKPEPTDSSLSMTAHRELKEELGVEPTEELGRLSSVPVYTSDFRLEPFVVVLDDTRFSPAPGEVSEVHALDLLRLINASKTDAIAYQRGDHAGLSPIYTVGSIWLYGASAHVLRELCAIAAKAVGVDLPPLRASGVSWQTVFDAAKER